MSRRTQVWVAIVAVVVAVMLFTLRLALKGEEVADVAPPSEQEPAGTRSVDLFFPSSMGGMVRETREIVGGDNLEGDVRRAVEELIAGGQSGERAIPSTTRLRHVFFDGEGEVTLDFTDHLRLDHPGGAEAELATLRCLASTLDANFPGVDRMLLLVDGEPVGTLAGHVDLSRPLVVRDHR